MTLSAPTRRRRLPRFGFANSDRFERAGSTAPERTLPATPAASSQVVLMVDFTSPERRTWQAVGLGDNLPDAIAFAQDSCPTDTPGVHSTGTTSMATDHIASAGRGELLIHSPARQGSFVIAREDLTITHARYAAGEHVAGRHIHHQHTDAFYILEGEVIFEIGPEAETITVSAGGFVAAPPGLAHSFRVAKSGPAR